MKILDTDNFVSERIKLRPVTNAELDQIQQDMNADKYELTDETTSLVGHTLHRIKALKDIPSMKVKKGDLGGFVESYDNLDQKGDCWVGDDAYVFGNAKVYDNAKVYGDALVYGIAKVYGYTEVYGNVKIYGSARVYGLSKVYDTAEVYGSARVHNCHVHNVAKVDYIVTDKEIC